MEFLSKESTTNSTFVACSKLRKKKLHRELRRVRIKRMPSIRWNVFAFCALNLCTYLNRATWLLSMHFMLQIVADHLTLMHIIFTEHVTAWSSYIFFSSLSFVVYCSIIKSNREPARYTFILLSVRFIYTLWINYWSGYGVGHSHVLGSPILMCPIPKHLDIEFETILFTKLNNIQ